MSIALITCFFNKKCVISAFFVPDSFFATKEMTILHKSTRELDKILAVYYRKVLKFVSETGNIESIEPQKSVGLTD